ncbi:HK97 gp10 family phage protein [Xenorhabdus griffiniae]|uniref:HK97 gp10 family phage protein n=1 Tax=Xenorhabdus griffiniae TaxID=351672 RepID=A0ABY9XM68_9GAMM|nr:HK97 gp10 family phage protein [Xenorhabdus griffiniae]MBD1228320.1 HK97 gp10 family phage protein [Xenorhabdus griffiniae]MBE8587757.1 HK97 gp10 family phage protein [Xenorhabdus griffiniae]WMV74043.1 HK97 gp10 family phage protein [Xenorhabdus griffiniae]WNH03723.1 HK97 gp10 family phage protein [Xenorhabdus griffiniae]
MGAKVRGIREAKSRLHALIGDIRGRKVVRAMYKALYIGSAQAALYTPIDTSTLINSQFRDVRFEGVRLTGRVGYSANYAVYVHDPNVKQDFRRATAKKEFLKQGFDEMRSEIDKVVAQELKL